MYLSRDASGKYVYTPLEVIQENLACTTIINNIFNKNCRSSIIVASKVSQTENMDDLSMNARH